MNCDQNPYNFIYNVCPEFDCFEIRDTNYLGRHLKFTSLWPVLFTVRDEGSFLTLVLIPDVISNHNCVFENQNPQLLRIISTALEITLMTGLLVVQLCIVAVAQFHWYEGRCASHLNLSLQKGIKISLNWLLGSGNSPLIIQLTQDILSQLYYAYFQLI